MPPKASTAKSTAQTYWFVRSDQSRTETATDAMIRRPPMVGVPCFVRWDCGPSSRTCWPILSLRSQRIIDGPSRKLTMSAVMTAPALRKVMYLKTLNPKNQVWSGYRRW